MSGTLVFSHVVGVVTSHVYMLHLFKVQNLQCKVVSVCGTDVSAVTFSFMEISEENILFVLR